MLRASGGEVKSRSWNGSITTSTSLYFFSPGHRCNSVRWTDSQAIILRSHANFTIPFQEAIVIFFSMMSLTIAEDVARKSVVTGIRRDSVHSSSNEEVRLFVYLFVFIVEKRVCNQDSIFSTAGYSYFDSR